jgi:V8-like Glu-specific endopeptidase
VSPVSSPPYEWITYVQGSSGAGTAFQIKTTAVKAMLLTAGHVVFDKAGTGNYETSLTINYGQNGVVHTTSYTINCVKDGYYIVPAQYISTTPPNNTPNPWDFGVIVLNRLEDSQGFPLVTLADADLTNREVETAGYPGDKPQTMWSSGGAIQSVLPYTFLYLFDTFNGASGSPVWTPDDNTNPSVWEVCAIHTWGQTDPCQNGGSRITERITNFINTVKNWGLGYEISDVYGGPHGTEFDDSNTLKITDTIVKFTLYTREREIAFSCVYASGITITHGSTDGDSASLTLAADEYLQTIQLYLDKSYWHTDDKTQVYNAMFTTNKGRSVGSVPAGKNINTITADANWQIAGFLGRADSKIYELGAVSLPVITI